VLVATSRGGIQKMRTFAEYKARLRIRLVEGALGVPGITLRIESGEPLKTTGQYPIGKTTEKMKKVIATIAITVFGAAIANAGEYPDISVKKLDTAIKKKEATIIDVNGSASYNNGHIPGAIDYAANKDKLEKLLPKKKDALIVAYCGGPSCNAYTAAATAPGRGMSKI
jgi:predicted sulfurtransferase